MDERGGPWGGPLSHSPRAETPHDLKTPGRDVLLASRAPTQNDGIRRFFGIPAATKHVSAGEGHAQRDNGGAWARWGGRSR